MTSIVNVFEEVITKPSVFAKYVERVKNILQFVVIMEKHMQPNVN